MFSHLTLGTNDAVRARRFYEAALAPLGLAPVHREKDAVAYGVGAEAYPWIWVMPPYDGLPATWGNGVHVAFLAPDRAAVEAFHAAGLAAGGRDEGAPGLRPHYAEDYYAAYLRDPDGNKLQAVHYGKGRKVVEGQHALSHVTLGTNDLPRARAFFDEVLGQLGLERLFDEEGGTAYCRPGSQKPSISTRRPYDGRPASWCNGFHAAFLAESRGQVDAFHRAALACGGSDEGAPGLRPRYSPNYYGAYVRDPDGNKLQAVCYREE